MGKSLANNGEESELKDSKIASDTKREDSNNEQKSELQREYDELGNSKIASDTKREDSNNGQKSELEIEYDELGNSNDLSQDHGTSTSTHEQRDSSSSQEQDPTQESKDSVLKQNSTTPEQEEIKNLLEVCFRENALNSTRAHMVKIGERLYDDFEKMLTNKSSNQNTLSDRNLKTIMDFTICASKYLVSYNEKKSSAEKELNKYITDIGQNSAKSKDKSEILAPHDRLAALMPVMHALESRQEKLKSLFDDAKNKPKQHGKYSKLHERFALKEELDSENHIASNQHLINNIRLECMRSYKDAELSRIKQLQKEPTLQDKNMGSDSYKNITSRYLGDVIHIYDNMIDILKNVNGKYVDKKIESGEKLLHKLINNNEIPFSIRKEVLQNMLNSSEQSRMPEKYVTAAKKKMPELDGMIEVAPLRNVITKSLSNDVGKNLGIVFGASKYEIIDKIQMAIVKDYNSAKTNEQKNSFNTVEEIKSQFAKFSRAFTDQNAINKNNLKMLDSIISGIGSFNTNAVQENTKNIKLPDELMQGLQNYRNEIKDSVVQVEVARFSKRGLNVCEEFAAKAKLNLTQSLKNNVGKLFVNLAQSSTEDLKIDKMQECMKQICEEVAKFPDTNLTQKKRVLQGIEANFREAFERKCNFDPATNKEIRDNIFGDNTVYKQYENAFSNPDIKIHSKESAYFWQNLRHSAELNKSTQLVLTQLTSSTNNIPCSERTFIDNFKKAIKNPILSDSGNSYYRGQDQDAFCADVINTLVKVHNPVTTSLLNAIAKDQDLMGKQQHGRSLVTNACPDFVNILAQRNSNPIDTSALTKENETTVGTKGENLESEGLRDTIKLGSLPTKDLESAKNALGKKQSSDLMSKSFQQESLQPTGKIFIPPKIRDPFNIEEDNNNKSINTSLHVNRQRSNSPTKGRSM